MVTFALGLLLTAVLVVTLLPSPPAVAAHHPAGVALFDPQTGEWHFRTDNGRNFSFIYGSPGDTPLLGDWDCDGYATVGMYRKSTGFVYLRNSNTSGLAELEYFFGTGGDLPIVGDWNRDGCDSVSIYRPLEGKVYILNTRRTAIADFSYHFGAPGDSPFAGDFNGDRRSDVGVHRSSSGMVYLRNSLDTGVADIDFSYGTRDDRMVAADWDGTGDDTVGIFRPSDARFYLQNENQTGFADIEFALGEGDWLPVAGTIDPELRIMPIGDSITTGQTGWHSYRCYLASDLSNAIPFFDFVGTQNGPTNGGPSGCPWSFDEDHEAYWGWRTDELVPKVAAAAPAFLPDVALVHLGINDLVQGQGAASTRSDLADIVAVLRTSNPGMKIFVAEIVPCDAAIFGSGCNDVPALNAGIRSLAAELTTVQSIVVAVDTGVQLSDLRDGAHPSNTGDQLIANAFLLAMESAGVL